ncbi:hypothetical protein BKI52_21420 [marine bacterium AO1-C]|nr:hypothetical protein BKI52_21420 [marine bacterium AO1-C]
MQIDDKYAKLHTTTEAGRKILFLELKNFIPESKFRVIWNQLEETLAAETYQALVVDCVHFKVTAPTAQTWFVEEWIVPLRQKFSCDMAVAVVNASSFFGRAVVKNLIEKLRTRGLITNIELFDNAVEVGLWLEQTLHSSSIQTN